jgi:hypothetical protein
MINLVHKKFFDKRLKRMICLAVLGLGLLVIIFLKRPAREIKQLSLPKLSAHVVKYPLIILGVIDDGQQKWAVLSDQHGRLQEVTEGTFVQSLRAQVVKITKQLVLLTTQNHRTITLNYGRPVKKDLP